MKWNEKKWDSAEVIDLMKSDKMVPDIPHEK